MQMAPEDSWRLAPADSAASSAAPAAGPQRAKQAAAPGARHRRHQRTRSTTMRFEARGSSAAGHERRDNGPKSDQGGGRPVTSEQQDGRLDPWHRKSKSGPPGGQDERRTPWLGRNGREEAEEEEAASSSSSSSGSTWATVHATGDRKLTRCATQMGKPVDRAGGQSDERESYVSKLKSNLATARVAGGGGGGLGAFSATFGAQVGRIKFSSLRLNLIVLIVWQLMFALLAAASEPAYSDTKTLHHGGAASHGARLARPLDPKKKAAAELVARHLLTNYYRHQLLSRRLAATAALSRPTDTRQGWSQTQPAGSSSSWTSSGDLLGVLAGGAPVHVEGAKQTTKPASAPRPGAQLLVQRHQPAQAQSTTPTLNKQLPPPPAPFYEFGLAPANVYQLEPAVNAPPRPQLELEPFAAAGSSAVPVMRPAAPVPQAQKSAAPRRPPAVPRRAAANATRSHHQDSMRSGRQLDEQAGPANEQAAPADSTKPRGSSSQNYEEQQQQQQQQQQPTDKDVEPRQKRRMFNRILKKTEWNHLFVEMSKVFVRYFLDLALKDIIGKQSAGSSAGGDTGGRKKLDAQSELADLFKDFVKTAISNM